MTEKRHGKGLLFIVTLVLAAGVIKYADIPFAQTVREKAASALSGAANADHVLRYSAARHARRYRSCGILRRCGRYFRPRPDPVPRHG